MVDENVSVSILKSLISRFQAQKDEAVATIMVYLRNPTGIGDHPNIIEELDKADAHPYGSRPFKRENYINKFNILTNKILSKKESNRFLKVVQNLKKIKPSPLTLN